MKLNDKTLLAKVIKHSSKEEVIEQLTQLAWTEADELFDLGYKDEAKHLMHQARALESSLKVI